MTTDATLTERSTIERLRLPMPADHLRGWLVAVGLGIIAFCLRAWRYGNPHYLAFDETYYAKDAWTLWHLGYEASWPEKSDIQVNAGVVNIYDAANPSMAAHPPLGKWFIGMGEALFGMNPWGWRFMSVVAGAIMVIAVVRLTRRLTRSTLIGGIAGLLLCLDGLAFVMSRLALLDIFQATLLVVGCATMLADRDWMRERLADYLEAKKLPDLGGSFGPRLWFRPWRVLSGVVFGMAIGVKWNSLFPLAMLCVLTLIWDISARRMAGAGTAAWSALFLDGIPAFCSQVVVALLTYLASWSGWLTTSGGFDRNYVALHPDSPLAKSPLRSILGDSLMNLMQLHVDIYKFHTNEAWWSTVTHPYNAHPAGWLLMVRPIGIDAINDIPAGQRGCPAGGDNCLQVISAMGTPVLWWVGFAAIIAALFFWIGGKDWRFSLPILALASVYLPWFNETYRPLFFFYAICIIPFTCIILAMMLGKILGPAASGPRRQTGAIFVGTIVGIIALDFAYIYPLLTDATLPHWAWLARMWLSTWI